MDDWVGYLAATCVLTATTCDRLFIVRLASMLSNICFVVYAASTGLMPVLALHAILLPLNAYKVLRYAAPGNPDVNRQIALDARGQQQRLHRQGLAFGTKVTSRIRSIHGNLHVTERTPF